MPEPFPVSLFRGCFTLMFVGALIILLTLGAYGVYRLFGG